MTQTNAARQLVTQYLVAFGDGPNVDLTTFTKVRGGSIASGEWTDITPFVMLNAQWTRGRQHEFGNFEAGSATIPVENIDGRFSPWNTSSPYNGGLKINRYLRVLASLGNLLSAQSASFETASAGVGGWIAGGSTTVARDATTGADGSASMKVTASATAAFSAVCDEKVAVKPGHTYSAVASVKGSTAGIATVLQLVWLDSTLTPISTSQGDTANAPTGSFSQYVVGGVAPANAVCVRLQVVAPSNVTAAVFLNVDKTGIFQGGGSTWSAGMTPRFTGHITAWPERWPSRRQRRAQITASDAFRYFAKKNITSTDYATTVLADGATSLYRQDDASASNGSRMTDSGPAAQHGSYVGTVTPLADGALITDVNPACYYGTGTTQVGYANIPKAAFQLTNAAVSYELWWKATSQFATNMNGKGLTLLALPSYDAGGGLRIAGNITTWGPATSPFNSGFQLQFELTNGVTDLVRFVGATGLNVQDGNWHHLVLTLSSDHRTMRCYVDGLELANGVAAADLNFGIATPADDATIMQPALAEGTIDEVAIYKGVTLTLNQILNHYFLGVFAFFSEQSGSRINAVLDVIGWPTAMRSIGTGVSTLQSQTTSLTTTKSLAYMQTVEQTEDGALFMAVDGKVTFVDRGTLATNNYGTPLVFGDNPGELPYEPGVALGLDDIDLYTEATVARVGGQTQYASNPSAVATYGSATRAISGTLSSKDSESLGRAQYEVARHGQPLERLESFTIKAIADPAMPTAILGLDLLDLVTTNRHDITGTAFAQNAVVEKLTERITEDGYIVDVSVSPVAATQYWVLGTSALGSTTRLSF